MIYGQYEYMIIDPDKLVVLPQVRKIKNAKIDEIVDSIEDRGLINPLDVAKLSYEELKNHIKFLNQLWKKNTNIDDFKPIGDFYYVVIAGHTRLEAIKKISKQKKRKVEVAVKIHKVKTSEEILAIQLDENIYSEPKLEERAIAIIETYRLGIINGKWHDKKEFIKQNQNRFSRRVLSDALVFADLPIEIQEYVFSRNIPFAVGVELGRIYPLIKKYEADHVESNTALEQSIKIHYATLLMELQRVKNISAKRALSKISCHAKYLNDHFRPKEELQQEMFEWFKDGAKRQEEIHLKILKDDYNKALRALNSMPFEYFVQLLNLDSN